MMRCAFLISSLGLFFKTRQEYSRIKIQEIIIKSCRNPEKERKKEDELLTKEKNIGLILSPYRMSLD